MKKETKTYIATSKTGKIETIRDSRDFQYGVFITTEKCSLCGHKCEAETTFQGCSKTFQSASRKNIQICKEAKYTKEIVELKRK